MEAQLILDNNSLAKIFRFAFEEEARRGLKSDSEPLSQNQILSLLFQDWSNFVDKIMLEREVEIKDEFKQAETGENGGGDAMAPFRAQAAMFRSIDKMNQEENKTLISTDEEQVQIKTDSKKLINIPHIIEEKVQTQPWKQLITEDTLANHKDITLFKLADITIKSFDKRHRTLLHIATQLGLG